MSEGKKGGEGKATGGVEMKEVRFDLCMEKANICHELCAPL